MTNSTLDNEMFTEEFANSRIDWDQAHLNHLEQTPAIHTAEQPVPDLYFDRTDRTTSFDNEFMLNLPEYDIRFVADLAGIGIDSTGLWPQPAAPFNWDFTGGSIGKLPTALDTEKWDVANQSFIRGLELTRAASRSAPFNLSAETAISAILFGWNTIPAEERDHPAWVALRQIDERVFGNWTTWKAKRLAMMYICAMMMKVSPLSRPIC